MIRFGLILLFALGALGCGAAQRVEDHPSLEWLSGAWVGNVDGQRVEEHWTPEAGKTMLGVGRTVADDQTQSFEYMRIEWRNDTVYYLASPQGRHPPTEFALGAIASDSVTFVNPSHDFPQRITYRRGPDALHIEIEGPVNGAGKVLGWSLQRLKP